MHGISGGSLLFQLNLSKPVDACTLALALGSLLRELFIINTSGADAISTLTLL